MAGTIVVDTIQNGAATKVVTTSNMVDGSAKAWVNFAGAAPSINKAFNVSSIIRNAGGDYTLNFSNAMADTKYAVNFGQQRTTNGTTVTWMNISASTAPTTTALRIANDGSGSTLTGADPAIVCATVFD